MGRSLVRLTALRRRLAALRDFVNTDTGAVTVDWTVLAAAVVGLGIASVAAVRTGVVDLADGIEGSLSGAAVASLAAASGMMWGYAWAYDWGGETDTHDHWRDVYLPGLTDAQLLSEFETMISEGHEGTAVSMDLAYFALAEMQTRGLATADHIAQLQAARATFP